MQKIIFIICLLFASSLYITDLNAQRSRNNTRNQRGFNNPESGASNITDRLFIGGSFGGSASTNYVFFDISPMLGYRVTDRLSIAAGPVYNYYNAPSRPAFNLWGASFMGRVDVLKDFLGQGQDLFFQGEVQNLWFKEKGSGCTNSMRRLPIGGGVRLGGRLNLVGILMYDILWGADGGGGSNSVNCDSNSAQWRRFLFDTPLIYRLGVNIGI